MANVQGAVLILAAGRGRRFGSDKRLATVTDNTTLLSASIACYQQLQWPVYVVLKTDEEAIQVRTDAALESIAPGIQPIWLTAADADLGMGHSLAAGVSALRGAGVAQALIGLGDMPFLKSETIAACATALANGNTIVRPRYRGQPGNPVGFGGPRLTDLESAQGDTGARPTLRKHAASIHWLDVSDPGILADIDRPEDLSAAAQRPTPG